MTLYQKGLLAGIKKGFYKGTIRAPLRDLSGFYRASIRVLRSRYKLPSKRVSMRVLL